MAYISIGDAQAWGEATKLPIATLDDSLEDAVSVEVLAKLAGSFNTTSWVDNITTPRLVRKIIAMTYVSWLVSRAYASDEGMSNYAIRLLQMANALIDGLIAGTILLVDDVNPADNSTAEFYPNDASSLLAPTVDDRSLGGPAFTMGVIW